MNSKSDMTAAEMAHTQFPKLLLGFCEYRLTTKWRNKHRHGLP